MKVARIEKDICCYQKPKKDKNKPKKDFWQHNLPSVFELSNLLVFKDSRRFEDLSSQSPATTSAEVSYHRPQHMGFHNFFQKES